MRGKTKDQAHRRDIGTDTQDFVVSKASVGVDAVRQDVDVDPQSERFIMQG